MTRQPVDRYVTALRAGEAGGEIAPLVGQRVLVERIYEIVKRGILTLEIPPGSPLNERSLAQRFAVSKKPGPRRVAASRRRRFSDAVSASRDGRTGSRCGVRRRAVRATYRTRDALAVALATPRLTTVDIAEGRRHLDAAAAAIEAGDPVTVSAMNQQFHGLFARRSGNRPLSTTLAALQDRVRVIRMVGWRDGAPMKQEHLEHTAILDAAAAGESAAAARLVGAHINNFRDAYRSASRNRAAT